MYCRCPSLLQTVSCPFCGLTDVMSLGTPPMLIRRVPHAPVSFSDSSVNNDGEEKRLSPPKVICWNIHHNVVHGPPISIQVGPISVAWHSPIENISILWVTECPHVEAPFVRFARLIPDEAALCLEWNYCLDTELQIQASSDMSSPFSLTSSAKYSWRNIFNASSPSYIFVVSCATL